MKTVIIVAILAAACGSGSSKPTTPVANPDPVPMVEPAPPKDDPTATAPPIEPEPAKPDPAKVKAELLAAETSAYEKAKPVFEANCARCHTKSGKTSTQKKRDHFDMTTYPFGGHHAMELGKQIRKSVGIDGSKPTMPYDKKGSVKGDDLALIATWADAFDKAHAGGAHDGHGGGHGDHKH
ncbi:MAG: hypothetical protein H0V17_10990 [Deltaproteobacteria bacterium]|nr:hypothetical protein [Deltaproteobacteria bacterium]